MFLVFDWDLHDVKLEREFSVRAKTLSFQLKPKTKLKHNLTRILDNTLWHARLTYNDIYRQIPFLHSRILKNNGGRNVPVEFNDNLLCWSNRLLTQAELNIIHNYLYQYCCDYNWEVVITERNFYNYLCRVDRDFVECRLLPHNNPEHLFMITEPFDLIDENSYVSIDDVMQMLAMLPPEIIDEIIQKYRHL